MLMRVRRSGEKERLDSLLSFAARDSIRNDHCVEMSQMRHTVGVVDGVVT